MSNRKKVTFGSKTSMVETWIIDDAENTRRQCGDVREIAGGMYDFHQTVTSGDDDITANHRASDQTPDTSDRGHMTINDSTFVVMGPGDNSVQPDTHTSGQQQQQQQQRATEQSSNHQPLQATSTTPTPTITAFSECPHNIGVLISNTATTTSSTTNNNISNNNSFSFVSSQHSGNAPKPGHAIVIPEESAAAGHASERRPSRDPQEEYFNVLEPVPKDQTQSDATGEEDEEDDNWLEPRQDGTGMPAQKAGLEGYEFETPPSVQCEAGRVDNVTGWPLTRSTSLESRDNPFLPGGDLSREAEDLLSRATIIRDHFYLNEEEKRTLREQQQKQQQQQEQELIQSQQSQQPQAVPPQKQSRPTKHVQIVDHHDGSVYDTTNGHAAPATTTSPEAAAAVEERISPQAASPAAAPAPPNGGDLGSHPGARENGKASGGDMNGPPASSDTVHVSIPDSDGQSPGAPPGDLQVQDADKKRRNKCCTLM